jgi:hypothetical protein
LVLPANRQTLPYSKKPTTRIAGEDYRRDDCENEAGCSRGARKVCIRAGRGLLVPASVGALAACLLVAGVGFAMHRPLARVPENTLKFDDRALVRGSAEIPSGSDPFLSWDD